MSYPKKLVEVALPLDAINKASVRENYIYRGNPSSLHKWWAQRPLAAARAIIFAQMVDDPSAHPDLFPTSEKQEEERRRLFHIIEDLAKWESTTDEKVLQQARDEIWRSWRYTCAENASHEHAQELFDPRRLPGFYDPFAGGGTLPLEAQRLGLGTWASDLNPVAVLINKAMIEIPPKVAGKPPVNPQAQKEKRLIVQTWRGAQGLAEDLRYYGRWMLDEAEKRIGHIYPKAEVTAEMARNRPDLKPYVGHKLMVIAWLWARTVKSPNPAFAKVDVPLASTFMLSTKAGKEVYLEPVIGGADYRLTVNVGKPKDLESAKRGTKVARGANFRCLMSGTPIDGDYIKAEGVAGRMGMRLMAIVADGDHGRVYLPATSAMEAVARQEKPQWKPDLMISGSTQYIGVRLYGMAKFSQLFTDRQLVALTTFSDLVQEARERVHHDALAAGLSSDGDEMNPQHIGAQAYADAIAVYLAFAINKHAMYGNTLVPWYTKEDRPSMLFTQQVLPMVWDPVEVNPFGAVGGSVAKSLDIVSWALDGLPERGPAAHVAQASATVGLETPPVVISTDPPYYDNVPYSDLSDFFYVWLRRSLKPIFPHLFATVAAPKAEELVAFAYRHDGKAGAEAFFLNGMTKAMHHLTERTHPAFPVTIYYAFKQAESNGIEGIASTGWDTFLEAVIRAGFAITGTWPMRTERTGRMRDYASNALASSIVLVCRPQRVTAPTATRREFLTALDAELPTALALLQRSNIAPVDLAQAAIGPGMAVFTRYASVLDAAGQALTVREALALINQTLDEALAEQEGDFDGDTRWALAWFDHHGFDEGDFGMAETLSKAKNTSVGGMVDAGIAASRAGKVRLLRPDELAANWDPVKDKRLTVWEMVHQLVRTLDKGGEAAAAALVGRIGSQSETARDLAYRLYTVCERKKRAQEALTYNALVQSWPEITRLARESGAGRPSQGELF